MQLEDDDAKKSLNPKVKGYLCLAHKPKLFHAEYTERAGCKHFVAFAIHKTDFVEITDLAKPIFDFQN